MTTQNSTDRPSSFENPNTRNNTFFLAKDISGYYPADYRYLKKSTQFGHLKAVNEGRCLGLNRYYDRHITRKMARHHIEALASQLELTPSETGHARRTFLTLDREGLGLESGLVAYCVCLNAVKQNDRNENRCVHPNVPADKTDDLFQQIADSLNLTQKEITKTYGKIRHRVDDVTPPVREDFQTSNHYPDGWGEGI